MSQELHELPTLRGTLQVTQFFAGRAGNALQLTQGLGGDGNTPGFIQLSADDVKALAPLLLAWLNPESSEQQTGSERETP